MNYKIDKTYFPNKKEYYKALFKKYLSFVIPYYIKTLPILQMSNDKQIAVEKIGYLFGWHWKKWKWASLTGRIFKRVVSDLPSPEKAQDHYAITGQNLLTKTKSENVIVYAQEDFMPYEFEPYMCIKLKP